MWEKIYVWDKGKGKERWKWNMGHRKKYPPALTPDPATLRKCVFCSSAIRDIPRREAAAGGQHGPGYERNGGVGLGEAAGSTF